MARPPVPVVRVGVGDPLQIIFPPVEVPADVEVPAFKTTADDEVFVVAMLLATVRSPELVVIEIVPVLLKPEYAEPLVIDPIVKAPLLRTAIEPIEAPDAIVPIEFAEVLKVNVPAPIKRALVAVIAPL